MDQDIGDAVEQSHHHAQKTGNSHKRWIPKLHAREVGKRGKKDKSSSRWYLPECELGYGSAVWTRTSVFQFLWVLGHGQQGNWGNSHAKRPLLLARIWRIFSPEGFDVCSSILPQSCILAIGLLNFCVACRPDRRRYLDVPQGAPEQPHSVAYVPSPESKIGPDVSLPRLGHPQGWTCLREDSTVRFSKPLFQSFPLAVLQSSSLQQGCKSKGLE